MKIAVAGGTGLVGRFAVTAAEGQGHEVLVLSRRTGIDLTSGEGVMEALTGVDVVIDVTNTAAVSSESARKFFATVTDNLLRAEAATGVKHHVALSIVGIDKIDDGYYAGKLAQEQTIAQGTVPYTIVRATQFHEFATQQMGRIPGPIALLPRCLMRPVSAREVGRYLLDIAEGEPRRRAQDLVGPRNEVLADLARKQVSFDGVKKLVLEFPLPGIFGRGLASGDLRGGGETLVGETTFDDWLGGQDRHIKPIS